MLVQVLVIVVTIVSCVTDLGADGNLHFDTCCCRHAQVCPYKRLLVSKEQSCHVKQSTYSGSNFCRRSTYAGKIMLLPLLALFSCPCLFARRIWELYARMLANCHELLNHYIVPHVHVRHFFQECHCRQNTGIPRTKRQPGLVSLHCAFHTRRTSWQASTFADFASGIP
jgi:hypothetical protein